VKRKLDEVPKGLFLVKRRSYNFDILHLKHSFDLADYEDVFHQINPKSSC